MRDVLARCNRIEQVRSGEALSLEAIDAAYQDLLKQPDKGAAYLDLVLVP